MHVIKERQRQPPAHPPHLHERREPDGPEDVALEVISGPCRPKGTPWDVREDERAAASGCSGLLRVNIRRALRPRSEAASAAGAATGGD
jgi:hypothetical protein